VATDVGDIREVAGETEGCYITDQSGSEIAVVVRQILNTGIRSHGRKRIFELGLNSESVALKISEMYTSICEEIRK